MAMPMAPACAPRSSACRMKPDTGEAGTRHRGNTPSTAGRWRLAFAALLLGHLGAQAQTAPATLRYDLSPNAKGYLSEIVDRSGTTEYTRDAFGRVIAKRQSLASGLVQQVSYTYTAGGQLASIGYPNGSVLAHIYDATGRLVQLNWNGNPLVSDISWNPMGQATAWTWAFVSPSLTASRSYDTAGRMTATEFSSYVWNAAGRITSLTQNLYQPGDTDPTHSTIASANTTWNVSYDAAGRITGFDATGLSTGFSYDANGNRTSSTKTIGGQITSRNYTVGAATTGLPASARPVGHDHQRELRLQRQRRHDQRRAAQLQLRRRGRLSAVTTGATDTGPTTRYAHNALGQRVFKTEPLYPPAEGDESDPGFFQTLLNFFAKLWGPTTTDAEKLGFAFIYDEDGTLIAETGTGGASSTGSTQYISLPTVSGPMPIAAIINGTKYAVHSDHLNTPRRMTNESGQAVWQWSYSAFGDERPTVAKYRFANLDVNPNPGTTSIAEVTNNLRYRNMYSDQESGLFYNGQRSYQPAEGGYTQNDPIGLAGAWNPRPYVDGNPLNFSDPTGQLKVCAIPVGCFDTSPPPLIAPDYPHPSSAPPSMPPLWSPVLAIPKTIMDACGALADWMFSRPKNPPDIGPPDGQIQGPRRGRQYGADGRPQFDIDKPHQGNERDHVHEWPRGEREEPGRPVSPWPRKQ